MPPRAVRDSFSVDNSRIHKQAPYIPPEPKDFTETQFVAIFDNIRRTPRGGAVITFLVDRDNIDAALKLWDVHFPLSVDIQPWQMYAEGLFDDDE